MEGTTDPQRGGGGANTRRRGWGPRRPGARPGGSEGGCPASGTAPPPPGSWLQGTGLRSVLEAKMQICN